MIPQRHVSVHKGPHANAWSPRAYADIPPDLVVCHFSGLWFDKQQAQHETCIYHSGEPIEYPGGGAQWTCCADWGYTGTKYSYSESRLRAMGSLSKGAAVLNPGTGKEPGANRNR